MTDLDIWVNLKNVSDSIYYNNNWDYPLMLDQSFMESYHWTNDQFGNALLNINKISSQTASFL